MPAYATEGFAMKIVSAIVILGSICLGSSAQNDENRLGKEHFLHYCSMCHGVDADGTGPLTADLAVTVPNLTTIAAGNDGGYPLLKVIQTIDGRRGVRAHGAPMPVYGGLCRTEPRS